MGFYTFMVVLEPEQPIYFPGQTVQGYVRVGSPKDVSCRRITVTFEGIAKVRWTETHGKYTRVYQADELYFQHQVIVWSGQGSGNTMGTGDKTFPFSYTLPRDIPSSFASAIGQVLYYVKAEAVIPWRCNQKRRMFFSVNLLQDLNLSPPAARRLNVQKEESVVFTRGKIILNLSAERSGYVPGESIVVNGEIVNQSQSTIQYTEVKLVQTSIYVTKYKKRQICRTVRHVTHPELAAGERDVWSSVRLPVPALPPTNLKHCSIIHIGYTFEVTAKIGFGRSATAQVPVIIGSLPLKTTSSTSTNPSAPDYPHTSFGFPHPPAAPSQEPHSADSPPGSPNFLPDEYRDVASPSYAYCVFGEGRKSVGDQTTSPMKFVPRYVTYKTGQYYT